MTPEGNLEPDDLTLSIGGADITGWDSVRLTLGMERCPNDFDIALTERSAAEVAPITARPGDVCTVSLGGEPVLTGYVDRYIPGIGPKGHSVHVSGRGKCQDLVDCSAEWPGGQISGANAAEIARKLADPFGITVTLLTDPGPAIPQFNFMLGETPWEIIERICRYTGLLPYELASGDLALAAVASGTARDAVHEGINVQQASVVYATDQRFSEYHVYLMAAQVLGDVGQGGNLVAVEKDEGVTRNRKRFQIAEAGSGGQDVSRLRAAWERSRRAGRGAVALATVDSWRDCQGKLWTPNTLVNTVLPTLRLPRAALALGEVTYHRDKGGTRADLVLMAPEAFTPEPVLLLPVWADLAQDAQ